MKRPEVHVVIDGVTLFADHADGSFTLPNKKERSVVIKALREAIKDMKSPTFLELTQDDGEVGAVFKPRERPRLKLVK